MAQCDASVLPEYVYAIQGRCMSKLKLGRWRGSVSKLVSRYTTPYGSDFDMTLFQTTDSVAAEKQLFQIVKPHHWSHELNNVEALLSGIWCGVLFAQCVIHRHADQECSKAGQGREQSQGGRGGASCKAKRAVT